MASEHHHSSLGILKNAAYSFTTWFLPLILGFVATPVIIRKLGDESYGLYALVLGFVGYSFNLNLGRAITAYVASNETKTDLRERDEIISSSLQLSFLVGFVGLVSIVLLSGWLSRDVYRLGALVEDGSFSLKLAGIIVFVSILTNLLWSAIQGLHRFDVFAKLSNLNGISLVVLNLVLVLSGFKVKAIFVGNLIVAVVVCLASLFAARKLIPDFRFRRKVGGSLFLKVLAFNGGVVGYQLSANALLLFERGAIVRFRDPDSLAHYVVAMMMGLYLHAFIASVALVLFPLSSSLKNDKEKLKALYLKAMKAVSVPIVFIAVSLVVQRELFLTVWLGRSYADEAGTVLAIHVAGFALLASQIVVWQMVEGLGYPQYNFLTALGALVVSLPLMYLFLPIYGLEGAAVARFAGSLLIFSVTFIAERVVFGNVEFRFWLSLLGKLGLAGSLSGLIQWSLRSLVPGNWAGFLLLLTAGGIAFVLTLMIVRFLRREELDWLSRFFAKREAFSGE
ncbi:MAG: oligosaccharide flippase family protein [Pyrinomonadaceae bacterium]